MKFNELGRSMVEMLGVLAIIGVLSVGAIAGYSKAMFKYKLNKHAESINILLNNSLNISHQLDASGNIVDADGAIYYSTILQKLGLIPDGISLTANSTRPFRDIFNNMIWIFYYPSKNYYGMVISFQSSSQGKKICYNVVSMTKENSPNLWLLETKFKNDYYGLLYGDNYCNNQNLKCLNNLTINEVNDLCNVCDENTCNFYILWK